MAEEVRWDEGSGLVAEKGRWDEGSGLVTEKMLYEWEPTLT